MPKNRQVKKVILHDLAIEYNNPVKGIYDFDHNGIFFAERGDILVTRSKVSDLYIKFLNHCGIDLEGVTFLDSNDTSNDVEKVDFFSKSRAVKELRLLLDTSKDYSLDSFMVTESQLKWASEAGLSSLVPSGQYEKFSSKSSFRKIAKVAGVNVARGYNTSGDFVEAVAKIGYLFLTGFNVVALKYDHGSAGIGIFKIKKTEFMNQLQNIDSFLSGRRLGINSISEKNFVVEGWYEDILCSPSIQFFIDEQKNVSLISMHTQLFYSDSVTYKGCLSGDSIKESVKAILLSEGKKLAVEMASRGYVGHLGFNTIVLKNEEVIWVEVNPRRVMSSYAFQIYKRLYKEDELVTYISSHVKKDSWIGKDIGEIINELEQVIYSPITKQGIIPFDYSTLKSEGRLTLLAFSTDPKDAVRLLKYAENI